MDALRNHSALVRSAKQDCRCELQMINRSFSPYVKPPFFPVSDLLICNVAHLSSHTPLFSGFCGADGDASTCVPRRLPAESQLSLLPHNDGPGHTSGSPWRGSHPAALPAPSPTSPFHGAEWLEIFLWLFSPAETTKLLQNQNNEERSCLSSRSRAKVTHALAQGREHVNPTLPHSIYQLSIIPRLIKRSRLNLQSSSHGQRRLFNK